MTNSMMKWHLARDNQISLARFCEKHAVGHDTRNDTATDGEHSYFEHTYMFDNDSYIIAEMLQGDTQSYSVADHFQVVDYGWGK
jgi:hypothetical protein